MTRFFILATLFFFVSFTSVHAKGPVRFDVAEMAETMVSCAAFYDVFEGEGSGTEFLGETMMLFLTDTSKTDEEASTWIQERYTQYHDNWQQAESEGSFEAEEKITFQRRECAHLNLVKSKFREE